MIEPKIKQSLDTILPTESEKACMQIKIKESISKRKWNWKWIATYGTICATAIFCIFLLKPTQEGNINQPRIATYFENQIDYKGNCYTYVGIHNGKNLIKTNDQVIGGIVYWLEGQIDKIVVYTEGEYQQYQMCKGE